MRNETDQSFTETSTTTTIKTNKVIFLVLFVVVNVMSYKGGTTTPVIRSYKNDWNNTSIQVRNLRDHHSYGVATTRSSHKNTASLQSSSPHPNTTTSLSTRIVGGSNVADPTRYPFFVSWGRGECGGSLIHSDIVLTAGHCFDVQSSNVVINAYQIENNKPLSTTTGAQKRIIVERSIHPGYHDISVPVNDVGLLRLNQPVHSSNGSDPSYYTVDYNQDDHIPADNAQLKIIGLGIIEHDSNIRRPILQEVTVTKRSDEVCDDQYSNVKGVANKDGIIDDNIMFCASAPGKDSCQGDSGGPIFRTIRNGDNILIHQQVGIVSFGVGCANPDYAGIYSKTSAASAWIQSEICRMSSEPPSNCFAKHECHDTFDDFPVNHEVGEKSCHWLRSHRKEFGYLCNFMNIALSCPVTCGSCIN